MYKCAICNHVSQSGESRKVYNIYRPDGSIAEEIPVCRSCLAELPESRPASARDIAGCRRHDTACNDACVGTPADASRCGHPRSRVSDDPSRRESLFGYVSGPRRFILT